MRDALRPRLTTHAVPAAAALGAAGLAALSTWLAYRVTPLVGVGLISMVFLVPLAVSRPHVVVAGVLALGVVAMQAGGEDAARSILALGAAPLVMVALLGMLRSADTRRPPALLVPVIAVILAAGVSALGTDDSPTLAYAMASLFGGAAMYLAIVLNAPQRAQVLAIVRGVSVAAAIIGLAALWEYLGTGGSDIGFVTSSGEVVGRSTGGFVHPNQLGGFLILPAALAIGAAVVDGRGRALHLAAVVLCLVGILVSFSRGALLGLAVIPFLFVPWRVAMGAAPLLALVVALAMPGLVGERFATLSAGGQEIGTRVDIWSAAWRMWTENPLTGVGIGGYPQAYATARVPARQYLPDTAFEPPPHAHNIELDLLSEQGIVGFLAWAALIGGVVRLGLGMRRTGDRFARMFGSAAIAGTAGFLVHNQFDLSLVDPVNIIFVFAFAGIVNAAAAARA